MAASWEKLIDDKLEAEFNKKGPDPRAAEKLRAKLLQSIETSKRQFASTEPAKGKKLFKINNSVVAFSPVVAGNPVSLSGKTTLFVPSEHFPAFLDGLEADVKAGKLDDALEQSADIAAATGKPGKRVRSPMSDEAKENMRRAAKAREEAKRVKRKGDDKVE